MARKNLRWKNNDEMLEFIRVLSPFLSDKEIGDLVGKSRKTIYRLRSIYGIKKDQNSKKKLPLLIIKSKSNFDNDLLHLKDKE